MILKMLFGNDDEFSLAVAISLTSNVQLGTLSLFRVVPNCDNKVYLLMQGIVASRFTAYVGEAPYTACALHCLRLLLIVTSSVLYIGS